MAKKRTTKNPAAAKKSTRKPLLGSLSLKSVRLLESHTSLNISGNQLPLADTDIRFEVTVGFNEVETNLLGNVTVTIVGKAESGSSLSIVVRYQAIFGVTDPPDVKELLKGGPEVEGLNDLTIRMVWPYAREFVSSLTSRMGLPSLTLPVFIFPSAKPAWAEQPPKKKSAPKKKAKKK